MKQRIVIFAVSFLISINMKAQTTSTPVNIEERVEAVLQQLSTHEKIQLLHAQSKFTSSGVPRLGVRQLNMDDGPHGVREELEWNSWTPAGWTNDYVVAFPSLTCLAATWNRTLSAVYGNAVSEEFAFRSKDIMLGPGVNIARTPLNGRAFEYMGEDPYLAGEMAVPYIKAVQQNGVGCCLKHFALNNQETDRFAVQVNVSERALREIYLPAFEKAVKQAKVWTVMGSYPLWKGEHMCHNDELLNKILKEEWQFDGAVISDWGGTYDTWEAAMNGLDIEMGTFTDGKLKESEFDYKDYYLADAFERLIEEGKIPQSVLDDKVRRVLRTIFRTAMNPNKVVGSQCSEAHYAACRTIAEEGIVLLKNDAVVSSSHKDEHPLQPLLPLDLVQYKKVLVVGENATRRLTEGGGSSELKTLKDVSPLEALQVAAQKAGCCLEYAQGYDSGRPIYDQIDQVDAARNVQLKEEALAKARQADLIIYIGGLNKNHRQDCENGDRESYDLPFGQNELITALANVQPQIVVVTFGGNPFAMPWLEMVPAMLHSWYLGSESGNALERVLTGEVTPSGRLPITFAKRYEDFPYVQYGAEAFPGVDHQVHYREDIFVGYRHFDTHQVPVLFPFGYGLSYTTFAWNNAHVEESASGEWLFSVEITNTGKRLGSEVVQLYVGKADSEVPRATKELRGFEKVSLQPGETTTVKLSLSSDDLRRWDEQQHRWTIDGGQYQCYLGASVADIKATVTINVKH